MVNVIQDFDKWFNEWIIKNRMENLNECTCNCNCVEYTICCECRGLK